MILILNDQRIREIDVAGFNRDPYLVLRRFQIVNLFKLERFRWPELFT